MSDLTAQYRDQLLIAAIADRLGFAALAERLPGDVYSPLLYFGVFLLFDIAVLNTYKHLVGSTHVLLVNPAWVAVPVGLLLGVVGVRYMADG